jgi:hypothetical protein
MEIELQCPCCPCRFAAASETPAEIILDRMTEDGPWFALGAGDTFDDMIGAALNRRGRIRCPDCGEAVVIHECAPELVSSEW